jgi:hypothetical protein
MIITFATIHHDGKSIEQQLYGYCLMVSGCDDFRQIVTMLSFSNVGRLQG